MKPRLTQGITQGITQGRPQGTRVYYSLDKFKDFINMSNFLNTVFILIIIAFIYACYNSYKVRKITNNNNII